MIVSIFLNIIYTILNFFVDRLPGLSSTSFFGTIINTASQYISTIHTFLPYSTISLVAIIGFDMVFESGYFFFKVIYWVIRRFPTQS